jgi:alkylation response protein AidB-like acyl-CoA dehydrogenase
MTAVGPTHDDLVAAAEAIVPRLAANADAGERARCLGPDSVAAMREAGLWRLLVPARYGGLEAALRTQVQTTAITSQGDPAVGWVQLVFGAHAWVIGGFPEACQDEVFAGPDVLIPGTLASQGTARPTEGGWLVSGRWQFCSGVDLGTWVLIGARQDDTEAGGSGARSVHVVVPKADVEVDDTWFTLGMRGTGSKDIVLRDVFVPQHRSMFTGTLFNGRSPHAAMHRTNRYRMPVQPCLALQLGGALVGMARLALRLHVERTRPRVEVYLPRSKAQSAGTQMRIAEASAEITSAELLLFQAADRFEAIAASGQPAALEQRAELVWHAAYVAELCRRATERIFAAAGAHAIYDTSRLQTLFRDVNTAAHHAMIDFDSNAEMFGRVALGLDPGTPLL